MHNVLADQMEKNGKAVKGLKYRLSVLLPNVVNLKKNKQPRIMHMSQEFHACPFPWYW